MQEEKNILKKIFSIENRTKYFVRFLAFMLAVSILVFSLLIIGGKALNKKERGKTVAIRNVFEEVSLEAKSAVVWDAVSHKELFSKNANESLPLASLTKVMTAVTTDGKIPDDNEIKITAEDLMPEGDSKLIVGDVWKAKKLRDFTLLTSSNDGAYALAAVAEANQILPPYTSSASTTPEERRKIFIKEMNQIAQKIGLKNSRFFNEHGLDRAADMGGAYGSAKDMAILFEYALKNYPEILEATRYKNLKFETKEKKYSAENTNIVVDKIPNLIASKTGFTNLAGGNLVIAFNAGLNHPIIISVLGSTQDGRFDDALKLVGATMKFINKEK